MTDISFSPLTQEEIRITTPWFEDEETRRWLGGPDWPEKAALRLASGAETEEVGRPATGRFVWLARISCEPVGLLDVELYDDGTAGLALVVAPDFRGRGIGTKILHAVVSRPELAHTDVLRVGIEPENRASVRSFEKAGFAAELQEPDGEGFVYFVRFVR